MKDTVVLFDYYLPRPAGFRDVIISEILADPDPAVANLFPEFVEIFNRSEFTITPMRIEKSQRMSNGTLRNYFVADKQQISLSWNMLPSYRTLTVDGAWGAEDLREFYKANQGDTVTIRINYAKNGTNQESSGYSEYTVKVTNFSAVVLKRGLQPFWDVSISLEEV